MNSHRISVACFMLACLLLVMGFFLWFDNPSVDVVATDYDLSGPAGVVGCSIAPWDAGTNGNRSGPGGEHLGPFYDEVASECYSANMTRYKAAIASGVLSPMVLAVGIVAAFRSRRSAPVKGVR
ncbi:MAG TPA: hypothetical protein VLJ88_05580 [Propionibacteriaceae bacterium]|nr:hypothetical protein [Propionibacteriaceae bacterium]